MLKKSFQLLSLFALVLTLTVPALAQSSTTTTTEVEPIGIVLVMMMSVFMCCFYMLIMIIPLAIILGYVYNVILVFDAMKRDFDDSNEQIVWILILFIAGFPVGTLLYHFLVMKKVPLKS